jgi:hypothetical protein
VATLVVVACGEGDLPPAQPRSDAGTVSTEVDEVTAGAGDVTTLPEDVSAGAGEDATGPGVASGAATSIIGDEIAIDAAADGMPFDRRLLGTNLPAWLAAERLRDPGFQAEALATGTTLVRLPGGSWSNGYRWLACELSDEENCGRPWAARPSDFMAFMAATGLPASWTVAMNGTAQEAAALVAFFNGEVGDPTPIGLDREGVDWETVDTWASLRAAGGHPEPVRIDLWEVGNEVYGGRPASGGAECASYGWEYVWTCDGTTYVIGDAEHDGYLAIRDAMIAVDPEIEVGAVGVPEPASWSNWGHEVIGAAGDDLDFYVVHEYGFNSSPSPEAALGRAASLWPDALAGVRAALGEGIPVAVTEYNLVAVPDGDDDATMTQAMNALYIAETIGWMAAGGVQIANQWNLADGIHENGTSYGLFNSDEDQRFPQFHALEMWSRVGSTLLEPLVDAAVRIYPTRHDDGRITIVVVNTAGAATYRIEMSGAASGHRVALTSVGADDPIATVMARSGVADLGPADEVFDVEFPAYSINLIEIAGA